MKEFMESKYLRSTEVNRRLGDLRRNRGLPIKREVGMVEGIVTLYSSVSCVLNTRQRRTLKMFDMKCFRMVLRA